MIAYDDKLLAHPYHAPERQKGCGICPAVVPTHCENLDLHIDKPTAMISACILVICKHPEKEIRDTDGFAGVGAIKVHPVIIFLMRKVCRRICIYPVNLAETLVEKLVVRSGVQCAGAEINVQLLRGHFKFRRHTFTKVAYTFLVLLMEISDHWHCLHFRMILYALMIAQPQKKVKDIFCKIQRKDCRQIPAISLQRTVPHHFAGP